MFAVVTALAGVIAAAPAPGQVRGEIDRVLAEGGYQTELPSAKSGGKGGKWSGADPTFEYKPRQRKQRREVEAGHDTFGQVVAFLFYILIGAGVVALLIWIITEMSGYWKDKPAADKPGKTAPPGAADAVTTKPLGDAEALAAQGDFGRAIHVLLLTTLFELSAKLEQRLPDALTSREVLAQVTLNEAARGALGGLIDAVEVSHFGGQAPGEADYQRCVGQFRQFATAYTEGDA